MKTENSSRGVLRKIARIFTVALFMSIYAGCGTTSEEKIKAERDSYMQNDLTLSAPAACEEAGNADMMKIREEEFNTEEYNTIKENVFLDAGQNPLSTFSIDVDKASYSNVRRFLADNQLPPKGAVRVEEMINYFKYDYPEPKGEHPFSVQTELSSCPWDKGHKLLHIGIQGKSIDYDNLKPSNLVFLVDVSGSMEDPNKLPLVKSSLKMLLKELGKKDRIALVTYAGNAGLVLPSTSCDEKETIERPLII